VQLDIHALKRLLHQLHATCRLIDMVGSQPQVVRVPPANLHELTM
jgi:hypothetical protein